MKDNEEDRSSAGLLIRQVLVFQFKLAMDGIRDVLLSPISIVAAIIGILTSRKHPARYFYRLMSFGHASDRWINLFNTYSEQGSGPTSDDFVRKAEAIVLSELQKGGVTRPPGKEAPPHVKGNADK